MIKIIALLFAISLTSSCAVSMQRIADTPTPLEANLSQLTGKFSALSSVRATELGLSSAFEDAGDGEYALTLSFNRELLNAIKNKKLEVRISILNSTNNVIAGLPALENSESRYWLTQGYKLQCTIFAKGNFEGLEPGVGYRIVLAPNLDE